MSQRRQMAMKMRHRFYVRRDLGLSGFCVYCGQIADSLDHVPPISLAVDLSIADLLNLNPSLLPCCRHCNSIIGDSLNLTLSSRREMIEKYLEKRYPSLLKAGRALEGVAFDMSDFRAMKALQVYRRWEFASTIIVEIPPVEPEDIALEVDEDDERGELNPKDCCMPFSLWCSSWQTSDARRILWEEEMPDYLRDGVRILTIEKDRDLIERLAAEIPEWAMQQADAEAKRLSEQEELFDAEQHQITTGIKADFPLFPIDADSEPDEEESSLMGAEQMLDIADDDEFSRALAALVLRNVNGPDSIGFLSDNNIKEIADILRLGVDETSQLLRIKDAKQLYMKISEIVIDRMS